MTTAKHGLMALGVAAVAAGLTLANPVVANVAWVSVRLHEIKGLYVASWAWVIAIAVLGFVRPTSVWTASLIPIFVLLKAIVKSSTARTVIEQQTMQAFLMSPWTLGVLILTVPLVVISISAARAEQDEILLRLLAAERDDGAEEEEEKRKEEKEA